jgi:tetratricopeptide (TPR) repeat protein
LAGLLAGLVFVVLISTLSVINRELLVQPFFFTRQVSVPLFVVLLAVFLSGFLPVVIRMTVATLLGELAARRERRETRQAESLEQTFRRAVDLEVDGQLLAASRELEVVLAVHPEDFPALLRYGSLLRRRGLYQEAIAVHQRGSVAHPRSVAMLYALATDYVARGNEQVAQEVRARILRDFPDRGLNVLRENRDQAVSTAHWSDAMRLQDAIDGVRAGAGEEPGSAPELRQGLAYQRGVALLEEDRDTDAAEIFTEILAKERRFIPARIMLGECQLVAGDAESALATWRAGFEDTGSPVFLQRIEDHLIEQQEPERAIETLRDLAKEVRGGLLARFFLGRLYYRLEIHEEAFKLLAPLEERLQGSATFHFLLGRIHERRGEIGRAAERYRRCATLLGVTRAEFACRDCATRYADWRDRCENCGSWNAIELRLDGDLAAELGVLPVPVWSAAEGE